MARIAGYLVDNLLGVRSQFPNCQELKKAPGYRWMPR